MSVSVPWRIVTANGIEFADTDDGQLFGLPGPVDGQEKSNTLLDGRRVASFDVDVKTADVRIDFEGGVRVELFNNSSGYEGWTAQFQTEDKTTSVVGLGGGDLAFF